MERRIVKGGIYSFIIGLLIGVLVFPDYQTTNLAGSNVYEIVHDPLRVYLFKLIRFSSILSLLTMIMAWVTGYFVFTNEKTKFSELVKGFIKALVVGLLIILVASLITSLFK
ncbi:hypothetical protein J2T12_001917 [Paenibacillus anaericanus]|uniref:hypothetical protein n=1 Tax=Paenibacillus anaericanus TaxID=170367 RepID=UPI00277DC6E2|nr:hypothetical protein [Paenibacillus anaericanus]MDQ0088511.1 hypothetical protein [Paenibacillus anaericanus]